MSNFSWDAMASDTLSAFGEEDWEDLESVYTHDTLDYELDRDMGLLHVTRDDPESPSTTPPQKTYAQVLAERLAERQR
jgi:hypothetical protein